MSAGRSREDGCINRLVLKVIRWLAAVALVVAAGLLGGGSTPAAALVETCYPPTSLCGIIQNPWIIADLNGTTGAATAVVGVGTVTAVGVATGVKVSQDNGAFDGAVSVTDSGVSPWTLTPDGAELPDASSAGGSVISVNAFSGYFFVGGVYVDPSAGNVVGAIRIARPSGTTVTSYSTQYRCGPSGSWLPGDSGNAGAAGPFTVRTTALCTTAQPISGIRVSWNAPATGLVFEWTYTDVTPPTRWIEQTVTCRRANGTTYDRTANVPVVNWVGTIPITVTGIDCDPGDVALDWVADVVGSGTGARTHVGEAHASDAVRSASNACLTGAADCKAVLEQLQADGTTWLSCHVSGTNCIGWWQSQNRAQTYRCRYGNDTEGWITVSLSVCSIYRDAAPGGSLKPATDMSSSASPGATDGSCDLGWGDVLNGSIVQKAVGCALTWAFVPDPAVVTELQVEASSAWSTSGTGLFWTGLIGVFEPLGDLGGGDSCGGLDFDLPLAGLHVDGTLFDTCTEPWSTYAPWVKGFLTCFVIVDGAWYLMRIVGAGLGWYVPAKATAPEQTSAM